MVENITLDSRFEHIDVNISLSLSLCVINIESVGGLWTSTLLCWSMHTLFKTIFNQSHKV